MNRINPTKPAYSKAILLSLIMLIGITLIAYVSMASALMGVNANQNNNGAQTSDMISAQMNYDMSGGGDFGNVGYINGGLKDIQINRDSNFWVSSPAQVSYGSGWALTSNSGTPMQIIFVDQSFVNTTSNVGTTLGEGSIRLRSEAIPLRLNLTSETNSQLVFNVVSYNDRSVTGTLALNEVSSFTGFTVWSGTLNTNENSYTVNLGTTDINIKGTGSENASFQRNAALSNSGWRGNTNPGLWGRMRSFFKF